MRLSGGGVAENKDVRVSERLSNGEASEAVAATEATAVAVSEIAVSSNGDEGSTWPGESAESAFLAEARARGEVPSRPATTQPVEEADPKSLPPLDDLVRRIPPEVMETLDELFRAKFVSVKRVPQSALKS